MPLLVSAQQARLGFCALLAICLVAVSASAQKASNNAPNSGQVSNQNEGLQGLGQTAETGVGEVGQRLTRWDIAPNTEPMARINRRVESRVENRLSSRIESGGRDNEDANSAFESASNRVLKTNTSNDDDAAFGTESNSSR